MLPLTKPEVIEEIHTQYLEAGADIIETNTFSATTIGQQDFLFVGESESGRKDAAFFQRVVDDPELVALVQEMNIAAARVARAAADRVANETGTQRFVAGSLGPLPVTASLSPDVNDPSFRAVTFDQIRRVYGEQVRALIEGGVDLLFVETIFDTLNAKAAIFAISEAFESLGKKLPVLVSGTITDLSGRTLTGQTVGAFLTSILHADPLVVGLNCALGPAEMRPHVEEMARLAPCFTSAYPNAGLPDPLSPTGFPETHRNRSPRNCATGRGMAGSTLSAAVVARRRITSARSRRWSAIARRAHCRGAPAPRVQFPAPRRKHLRAQTRNRISILPRSGTEKFAARRRERHARRVRSPEIWRSIYPASKRSTSRPTSASSSSANGPTSPVRLNFRS